MVLVGSMNPGSNPFITQNVGNAGVGFGLGTNFGNAIAGGNGNGVGSNPADKIDAKNSSGAVTSTTYPPDLGKYRFVILESDVNIYYNLAFTQMFVLPLPYGMTETHTTNYDANFNFLDAATRTGSSIASSLAPGRGQSMSARVERAAGGAIGGIGSMIGAATGLHINQAKWVTLKNPSFNQHKFAWKFSPKNFGESKTIQKIIYDLKTGMLVNSLGGPGAGAVFSFPKIYMMFYSPNMQYLYKFKPCVLQHIEIDYQGNNPAPAFYPDQRFNPDNPDRLAPNQDATIGNQNVQGGVAFSPPESIVIHTTWLELEVWTQKDFSGKMSTSDPFDGYSWYGGQ